MRAATFEHFAQRFADQPRQEVVISGASGLLGSDLAQFWKRTGHRVRRMVRSKPADEMDVYWNPREGAIDGESLASADAVIHLAGENIADGRWNEDKKARIRSSRVDGTRLVATALAAQENKPHTLICASAMGYYGTRPEPVDESARPGEGFLAETCVEWERATEPARDAGIRVINLRIGIVLSPKGGALAQMLTPFKFGLGGKLGSGDQWMSWVALADVIGLIDFALHTREMQGPVNATAPEPVTNAAFTETLGEVLKRPTFMKVPKFAVKLALGEMGEELLMGGARVLPKKAQAYGYEFAHPQLADALAAELSEPDV
jgi:hypothetical protein